MKKIRLYTFTFIGISIIVLAVNLVSLQYLYRSAKEKLWNSKMESGQREAREMGRLLEEQLKSGLTQQQVIQNLQQSILNTDVQSGFICMYNTKGVELCHPDPALIGQKIEKNNSLFRIPEKEKVVPFNEILGSGKSYGGLRMFPKSQKRNSQIVNVYPVRSTDWMVASHANIAVLQDQLSALYDRYVLVFLLTTLVVIVSCYSLTRFIYRKYEQKMEAEINDLNDKVNSLTILNQQLYSSQERLHERLLLPESGLENTRRRMTTYYADKLISLEVKEIAYFFLEDGNNYIKTFTGIRYAINVSLDELMKQLDHRMFYRANRQFIVNIEAIKTIFVYGKNQLKLIIEPPFDENVIISKNKVAEFKKWLDQ